MRKDLIMTWNPVAGATSYDLQLTADTNFTNPVLTASAPTARYVPSAALPHGEYRWHVRAVNADGRSGWSDAVDFSRGWEVMPTGLAYSAKGVFSWTPIGGAASYDVELSTREDFLDLEQFKGGYLCRTNHPWFTNLALLASAEEDTECRTPEEVDPSPSPSASASPSPTPTSTVTPPKEITPIPAGRYYWRVRGIDDTSVAPLESTADSVNGAGCQGVSYETLNKPASTSEALPECSRWSRTYDVPNSPDDRINIGAIAVTPGARPTGRPTNVVAMCPSSTTTPTPVCTNDTPVITWTGVTGATTYKVSIGPDRIFGNAGDHIYATQLPSAAPRVSLPDRIRYYVIVQACAAACGPTSDVIPFTKTSDAVVLDTPIDEVTLPEPILMWQDYLKTTGTLEAKEYRIQIGTAADFESPPVVDVRVDRAREAYGISEYQPEKLPDGTYYWRIQAIDASDRGLTWSSTRTVTVDATAPVGDITTPNGMPITGTVLVLFSERVTGVTSTTLQLFANGETAPTPGTVLRQSAISYSITPTAPLVTGQTYRLYVSPRIIDIAGNSAVAGQTRVRTATTVIAGSPSLVEVWDPDATPKAYGGGMAKSATRGASETLTLWGPSASQRVTLYGVKSSSGGWGRVYAGSAVTSVSFYSRTVAWRSPVWSGTVPALASGRSHVIKVVVQGTPATGSHGSYVYLDQWTVGTSNYQEAFRDAPNAQHSVTDSWGRRVATDALNGTKVVSMDTANRTVVGGQYPTSTATVAGRSVTVKVCRSPASGYADVTVDGVRRASISLYQSYTSCGFTAYTGALTAGVHKVAVAVTGRVPTGSRGSAVAVDMVRVT